MILRATSVFDADVEREAVGWLVHQLGEVDANELCTWIWRREHDGPRFVRALQHICAKAQRLGPSFLRNLVAHAKRPRDQTEAEEQLMQAMLPYVQKAQIAVMGHRNDPKVVEEELEVLRLHLRECIRRMWPDKHRATVDGAIVAGTQIKNGRAVLDYGVIAETLMRYADPLATTAAASHG